MTSFSAKTVALTAVIALGSLMSGTAHAAIVRSTNGAPVLTHDGSCVISNWEGSEDCEAAKAAAGMGDAVAAPVAAVPAVREGVVYFDFNKATLTPEAKKTLDGLAAKISTPEVKNGKKHHHHEVQAETITVVGYADRLGKADYNQKLATKRAEVVRTYLLAKGVKAKKIEVRSFGKTAPKADCPADLARKKLIDCLREDRRVEVEVNHK